MKNNLTNVILAIALTGVLAACGEDPSALEFVAPKLGTVSVEAEAFRVQIRCPVSGNMAGVSAYGIRIGEATTGSSYAAMRDVPASYTDGFLTATVKSLSQDTRYNVEVWMTNGSETIVKETSSFQTKRGDAVVEIHDPVFRRYIMERFDQNQDDVLTEPEALQVREIYVCTDSIYSLRGIEKMGRLTSLIADGSPWGNGHLPDIDLSGNPLLEYCHLESNQIHKVDLSHNPLLWNFSANVNPLDSIDFSRNPNLREIGLNGTDLEYLPEMTFLDLTSLHFDGVARFIPEDYFRHFPNLYGFNAARFEGSHLDLSLKTKIDGVWCHHSPNLEELDLTNSRVKSFHWICVTECPKLQRVLLRAGTVIENLEKDSHTEVVYVE